MANFTPSPYGIKPNVQCKQWNRLTINSRICWTNMIMTCALRASLLQIIALPCPSFLSSALLQPCDHLRGFLPFAVAGRSPSTSTLTALVMPSLEPPTALLVPPTLSFSQFSATPLGSWVLSEKLFFTEPHRCQPMEAWEEDATWWCTANVKHSQLHTSWRESTFREHECFYF